MTGRDRIVVIVVAVVALLGAAWVLVVSPERQKASQLASQVAAAQTQLASAEGTVASARSAQSQYATAYASLVSLGKAVPPSDEVPALIDQLTLASKQKNVDFSAISPGAGAGAGARARAGAGASARGSATSGTATAGFTQLPFSFTFEGTYFDLEHLFNKLTEFATLTTSGKLEVSGRLLTINSVSLAPGGGNEPGKSGGELTGSITATAYVMPPTASLAGANGTGSPASAGASPASSTSAGSSTPAPAIVKVNP
ncbi:MAG: type 4a pilus biogenesis protein PilO [Solirubrobacteraceae bacterium]